MSLTAVARKDFQDARRSRSLWVLSALFVLLAVALTYAYGAFPEAFAGEDGELSSLGLVFFLSGVAALFISLTALVVAYKSVAGEQELGSMKVLLSLPHTRSDVVFGKVLGRTLVMVIPVVLGFTVAGVLAVATVDNFSVLEYGLFVLMTAVFALVYVSLMVGISASTNSTSQAAALAVGVFLLFELLWDGIVFAVVWAANGFSVPGSMPDWSFIVLQMAPSTAYTTALRAVIPDAVGSSAEIDAFYATPWLGVLMLVLWLVVPLAIGARRFGRADL